MVDTPERKRYELVRDGEVLGFAAYQRTDQLVVFTHTEVDPALEGQGIGSKLVRATPSTPTSTTAVRPAR